MKLVINKCYGGFGLSQAAVEKYFEIKGWPLYIDNSDPHFVTYWKVPLEKRTPSLTDWKAASKEERIANNQAHSRENFWAHNLERDDPVLVEVVEKLGSDVASGSLSLLEVVEIPDGISWEINDYDGIETVAESHRTWG